MPFLDTPKGRSDGGYAVADFRKVRPDLGTMEDLAALADKCHKNGMNLCMDFVMNTLPRIMSGPEKHARVTANI